MVGSHCDFNFYFSDSASKINLNSHCFQPYDPSPSCHLQEELMPSSPPNGSAAFQGLVHCFCHFPSSLSRSSTPATLPSSSLHQASSSLWAFPLRLKRASPSTLNRQGDGLHLKKAYLSPSPQCQSIRRRPAPPPRLYLLPTCFLCVSQPTLPKGQRVDSTPVTDLVSTDPGPRIEPAQAEGGCPVQFYVRDGLFTQGEVGRKIKYALILRFCCSGICLQEKRMSECTSIIICFLQTCSSLKTSAPPHPFAKDLIFTYKRNSLEVNVLAYFLFYFLLFHKCLTSFPQGPSFPFYTIPLFH